LATGLDLHSVFVNPLLTKDPPVGPESVILQAISSCIDAGIDVGLTRDYFGNSVPKGSGWDIGAYEYASAVASSCGDTYCNGTETCSTCPTDCGVCPPPDTTPPSAPTGVVVS